MRVKVRLEDLASSKTVLGELASERIFLDTKITPKTSVKVRQEDLASFKTLLVELTSHQGVLYIQA